MKAKQHKLNLYIGILIFLTMLYLLRAVFAPFIIGFVISYILLPVVDFLVIKCRIKSRALAIIIVFFLLIILFTAVLWPVFTKIVRDIVDFYSFLKKADYSKFIRQTKEIIIKFMDKPFLKKLKKEIKQMDYTSHFSGTVKSFVLNVVKGITTTATSMLSGAFTLALVPVVVFYMLLDTEGIKKGCMKLIPVAYKEEIIKIIRVFDEKIKSFFRGQLVICIIIGAIMTVGLMVAGIKFPHFIGPLSGLLNIIPYMGVLSFLVITAGVIVTTVGFTYAGLKQFLAVVIIISVVQALDGYLLTPKIIGESLKMNPLLILFVLTISGKIFGITGLVIAVPMTAAVKSILFDGVQNVGKDTNPQPGS